MGTVRVERVNVVGDLVVFVGKRYIVCSDCQLSKRKKVAQG